jgi:hypothetical protein
LKHTYSYILTKFLLFPTGFLLLLLGLTVLFNLKTCSGELIDYRNSIANADENFIEGYVDARSNLIKTKFSGTNTIAYIQEEDIENNKKKSYFSFKNKNEIKSLNSNIIPFLLKSKNNYIYFGFYGKEFTIDHDYDFIYETDNTIQVEKHIYDKEFISIFTERGDLKTPDSISTPFILYRGTKEKWLNDIDKKINEYELKFLICYTIMGIGVIIILSSIFIRKKIKQ